MTPPMIERAFLLDALSALRGDVRPCRAPTGTRPPRISTRDPAGFVDGFLLNAGRIKEVRFSRR